MKKIAKRACATILASTMLTSMFSLSSISVAATEVDTQASTQTNVQAKSEAEAQSDEKSQVQTNASNNNQEEKIQFFGATGNISLEDSGLKDTVDIDVISTPEEYYHTVYGDEASGISLYNDGTSAQTKIALPESYDNSTGSNQKYFPPVGNQGQIGSCTNWSQTYYQFSYAVNRKLDRIATYQNSFSPKFTYNLTNKGLDEGSVFVEIYDLLMGYGAPSLETLNYDEDCFSWSFDEKVWTEAARYKVKSYQQLNIPTGGLFVTSADDSDLDIMKTALANGDILTYSTLINSWNYTKLKVNSEAPENEKFAGEFVATHLSGNEGLHRMTIVGYNDNIWTDINGNDKVDSGEMGAFKIVNSWGDTYANKGFAWVAYDALNDVSSVKDVEVDSERNSIFWEITRIDIEEEKNPISDVFLKYTVNSATRTKTPIKIVAERYNTKIEEYIVPYDNKFGNCLFGNEFSYAGTATAADATFVVDLTRYFPNINSYTLEQYSISVIFSDIEADSNVLTVKDVEIVDKYRNRIFQPTNFSQFTLDGATKTVDVLKNDEKFAIVYYSGYRTPKIEYKTQNGNWISAPGFEMEETTDIDGYTHKHAIYLGDSNDYALIRFNDGNGTYDTNGGNYYTAYQGISYFKTSGLTPPEIKLTYKTNLPDDGIMDLSEFIAVDLSAEGGIGAYKYRILTTSVNTGITTRTSFEYQYQHSTLYFSETGDYIVTFIAQDQAGNQGAISFNISVKDLDPEIEYFRLSAGPDIYAGEVCRFEALTNYENKFNNNNEYKIEIYNYDRGFFYPALDVMACDIRYDNLRTDNTSIFASWTPDGAGNYIAYLTVKDSDGKYARSAFEFKVLKHLELKSFDVSPDGKGGFFEIANMTANATGGKGTLQYQFSYWRMGSEYIIQDYSTQNTASMQFGVDTGDYNLIVRVKDSTGAVVTQRKTFTVLQTYISTLSFSNTSAKTGDEVVITPTLKNDSSVLKAEHYKYTVTKDGATETLTTSDDKTAIWIPKEIGTYTIKLEIRYSDKLVAVLSREYSVNQVGIIIDSFDVSPDGKGGFFEVVNMTANASGGTGTLYYRFSYWRNGSEYLIQDYSTDNTASMQFGIDTGDYDLIVRVSDMAGVMATKRKTFTVLQTYIKDFQFNNTSAGAGENIIITPTVKNDSSVLKVEHYKYTVTKDGVTQTLTTSANKTATWLPKESGTYKVQLEIRYSDTLVSVYSVNYEVIDKNIIAYLEVSPERQSGVFENIKLTASATGGTGLYQYKFYYRKDGNEYVIKDFDASNTVTLNYGNKSGYYDFFVVVKDSNGYTSTTQQLFILRDTYINKLAFNSDNVMTGETVKITPTVEYEASVIKAENYTYTVTKDGVTETLKTSDDKTASWTPTKAGKYTVKLEIRYNGTLVASRSVECEVTSRITIESFEISPDEKGGLYETVSMTANATGDTDALEYQFAYILYDDEYIVQDYSTNNKASVQLDTKTGVYKFVVKVKDSKGNVVTAEKEFVMNYTYIGDITFNKSTANTGETIVITPTVYHESSVFKPEHYIYTVTKDGVTQTIKTSSDKTASWTPTEAGTYTVKLQLKYGDNYSYEKTKNITITQAPVDNRIYFIPSTNWKEDNARFAVYAWHDNNNVWVSLIEENGVYSAELGEEYTNVIFCRMNPATSENNWNNRWNQTADIVRPTDKNCFEVNAGEWTGANGTWSKYVPPVKGVSILGDINLTLDSSDKNIYTGIVELDKGTYSFKVNDNGEEVGLDCTVTDTANIDYSAGNQSFTTLIATGGKYTFTYNVSTKTLKIDYEPVELLGDVNGDGNVTVSDIIFVMKHIVGEITLDDEQSSRADMDSNGRISMLDALNIQKMILEMV